MAQFTCGRLKRKPGIWRVDGIGNAHATGSLGTRITYLFSKIDPKYRNQSDSIHAIKDSEENEDDEDRHYQMNGHSSWLRIFTPGSIWENGKETASPKTITSSFTVDTKYCIYTSPNAIPTDFATLETLFPESHLNFGENYGQLSQTHFALIKNPESSGAKVDYLIIPTAELFRFYVGASSRLLLSALTGRSEELVQHAELVEGKIKIYDPTGTLTHREACFFGRTLVSDEARETFFGSHKHLVASRISNSPASAFFINSRFPFNGKTTLQVAGKRVLLKKSITSGDQWGVYVTQIRNCSHPLGFDSLSLVRTGALISNAKNRSGYARPPRSTKTDLEIDLEINDFPADRTTGTLITRNPATSLADQIKSITFDTEIIRKDEFDRCARKPGTPSTGNTFEGGSGDGNGTGNQSVEDTDTSAEPNHRSLLLFVEMLTSLREKTKESKWEIKTLPCKDYEQIEDEIANKFPSMNNRYSWYKIFSNETPPIGRPRKVIWGQVKIENMYIHLIEMELRDGEEGQSTLAITPYQTYDRPTNLSEQDFENLLKLTAVHNGWPPQNKSWKSEYDEIAKSLFKRFKFERLPHPYATPAKTTNKSEDDTESDGNEDSNKTKQARLSANDWATDIQEKITWLAYH